LAGLPPLTLASSAGAALANAGSARDLTFGPPDPVAAASEWGDVAPVAVDVANLTTPTRP
jgi:hypothetical protein